MRTPHCDGKNFKCACVNNNTCFDSAKEFKQVVISQLCGTRMLHVWHIAKIAEHLGRNFFFKFLCQLFFVLTCPAKVIKTIQIEISSALNGFTLQYSSKSM